MLVCLIGQIPSETISYLKMCLTYIWYIGKTIEDYFKSAEVLLYELVLYKLIHLNVNLALLSAAANQRSEFGEILHYDWLPQKVSHD